LRFAIDDLTVFQVKRIDAFRLAVGRGHRSSNSGWIESEFILYQVPPARRFRFDQTVVPPVPIEQIFNDFDARILT
jgi:hypothetical protein